MSSKLLDGVGVSTSRIGMRVWRQLGDFRSVLTSDYHVAPGLPPRSLLRELSRIVDREIKPHRGLIGRWQDPRSYRRLVSRFGPPQIEVRAHPYRRGAGLDLWGFSCMVPAHSGGKFLIFVNSAHERGAVAATIGHELGHYIYGAIGRGTWLAQAMESTFAAHLASESELFSDSVVALSTFSIAIVRELVGRGRSDGGTREMSFDRLRRAFEVADPRFRIDLTRRNLTAPWRIRYLTSMVHFFKLRCALFDTAEI